MPRGRRPKPTHLRVLEGNPGKRPLNRYEPKPEPRQKAPVAPRYLGKKGQAEWRRVAKELTRLGLLTDIDLTALGAYCASYQRWLDAEQSLAEENMVFATPTGQMKRSPYVQIAHEAMADMKAFMIEFGMTPSSRSRINVSPPKQTDDTEEFLFGNRNTG